MKLIVHTFRTLDGVMQAPGGAEEDPSGGFPYGGWSIPLGDEGFGRIVTSWLDRTDTLLFGRRTYEMMAGYWPQVTDPENLVAARLNAAPKHVVTSTLTEPAWGPVTLIDGASDVAAAVRALKEQPGGELQVHGSWQLVQTLNAAGLVDEYRIITFPIVLGTGKRLFDEGAVASGFTLVDHAITEAGAVYQALQPKPLVTADAAVEDGREIAR